MARYKPTMNVIENLEDAYRVLQDLCALESAIERIDADADKDIAKIKERAAVAGKELRDRVKEQTATLKAFCDYRKGDLFKDRKSLECAFGAFGYRKNPPSISTAKDTVELLDKLGLSQYVRVRREADKEAMLSLTDETLAQVDAVRKSKEEFFVQPKREQVNKDLLEKSA